MWRTFAIVAIAGCTAQVRLDEPDRPGTPCAAVETCISSALLGLRNDLAAMGPKSFAAFRKAEVVRLENTFSMSAFSGKVELQGTVETFDPPDAWAFDAQVEVDPSPKKQHKPDRRVFVTGSGRLVSVWFHLSTRDKALRDRVDDVAMRWFRTLGNALTER